MRYRRISTTGATSDGIASVAGDMVFGQSLASFWIDTPEAVAQAVTTRLRLLLGEFFLDVTDGTPWFQSVLDVRTKQTRDAVIRNRILGTQGVTGIVAYASQVDPNTRTFTVQADITTAYGNATVSTTA